MRAKTDPDNVLENGEIAPVTLGIRQSTKAWKRLNKEFAHVPRELMIQRPALETDDQIDARGAGSLKDSGPHLPQIES